MLEIQLDVHDVFAEDLVPKIINIVEKQLKEFSKEDYEKIQTMIRHLKNWDYEVTLESIESTIFYVIFSNMNDHLFLKYFNDQDKYFIINNYPFMDFISRLIYSIE